MNEPKDSLQPETIDHVIEDARLSQHDRQASRLIEHLHRGSQEYASQNEHSLDRIWARLAQSKEHTVALQAERKRPEEARIDRDGMEGKEAIQGSNIFRITPPPIEIIPATKRRSPLRLIGISLVAAIVMISILSFTIFSSLLHPLMNGLGAVQQQKGIHNGKLVCSTMDGGKVTTNEVSGQDQLDLDWSVRGQIAIGTRGNIKAFSAKNCGLSFSQPIQQIYQVIWSPDGSKLAMESEDKSIYVLDTRGTIVAHLPFAQLGASRVGNVAWSPDSNKLVIDINNSKDIESFKSIDLTKKGKVTNLLTLPADSVALIFSPDSQFILLSHGKAKDLEVWNVYSGKKVSTILLPTPTTEAVSGTGMGWTFSFDGYQLALEGNIYDTLSGKRLSSFKFPASTAKQSIIAWSPDGKYLAVSTNNIRIYDIHAKKTVAMFGKVDAQHTITALVWAPDSKGVAYLTTANRGTRPSHSMVNVWRLV